MVTLKPPERQWSRSFASLQDLEDLFRELERRGAKPKTKRIFRALAGQRPDRRLAINLKMFLGLTAVQQIDNILVEGLAPHERSALIELDMGNYPTHLREVAHGLLNVHERWIMLKALSKAFKNAKIGRRDYLDVHLLGDILGKEDPNGTGS